MPSIYLQDVGGFSGQGILPNMDKIVEISMSYIQLSQSFNLESVNN